MNFTTEHIHADLFLHVKSATFVSGHDFIYVCISNQNQLLVQPQKNPGTIHRYIYPLITI